MFPCVVNCFVNCCQLLSSVGCGFGRVRSVMMTAAFLCAGFPDPHGLGGFHCGFVLSCQLSMLKFGVHEMVEEVQGFKGFVF